jgi:hypothetical protein
MFGHRQDFPDPFIRRRAADYYQGLHTAGRYSGTGIIRISNGNNVFPKNILIPKKMGFRPSFRAGTV